MIIFCFLTYNDIIPYKYWNNFFQNIHNDKYQVWIHSKYDIQSNIYNFPIQIIKNKINTKNKCDISIVQATMRLFQESFNNIKGTHFIFCSQNCIPLYDFNFYDNLCKKLDKSIVSFINDSSKQRYYQLHKKIQEYITHDEFVKQQPNMILVRKDVELLINNDLTEYFKNMQCPDEHYFVNILIYILKKNIIKSQTHFCNFDLTKTQALSFKDPSDDLINKIKKEGFLFMRKVY